MIDSTQWIYSLGGPFLVLPQSLLNFWDGSNQSDPPREIVAEFRFSNENDPATDYDRACDLSFGYMAPIAVNGGYGIVMGDRPMPCAVWEDENTVYLIRLSSDRPDETTSNIIRLAESERAKDSFTITLPKGEIVVFDAAYAGSEVEKSRIFSVEGGDYLIECFVVKTSDTYAVICKLSRQPS